MMKMSVDDEITLKMAHAAQLEIPPDQVDHMRDSINEILDFCSLVGELDTSDTPDFTWKMIRRLPRREDEPVVWQDRDAFKNAAPTSDGDFFKVPRIIVDDRGQQ